MNEAKFKIPANLWKLSAFLFAAMFVMMFSCKDDNDDDNKGGAYDPKRSIELTTFYPDSGKYLEKIMLTGSNFGNDPEQIRVYFNSKKAAVVGTTDKRMYVLAPRLPGDTCIISVAIGEDSITFDKPFMYHTSVTVTTIAGNGNWDNYQDGSLNESEIQPRYLCVDKEDNIFFMNWSDHKHVARIDEEANELITVARDMHSNAPAADPVTGVISFPTETTVGSFVTLDPKEMWAPRLREMKWNPEDRIPTDGWKHAMVVNPTDGLIYCRYYFGDIISINPKTFEVERIAMTDQGDNNGLTFKPGEPNILYMSFRGNAGANANSICKIDVSNPETTFMKLTGPTGGGHRDGPLATAQFREPQQIFTDQDGNMYIADSGNHCIRRITTDGMVETVLGMPGTAGWKDGGKEEALFNEPSGLGISSDGTLYVADFGNRRIRKLSIN